MHMGDVARRADAEREQHQQSRYSRGRHNRDHRYEIDSIARCQVYRVNRKQDEGERAEAGVSWVMAVMYISG